MDLEDDTQTIFPAKTYKKLYKICKTISQMMQDRGYGGAKLQLEEFDTMGYEGFFEQYIKAKEDFIVNGKELMFPLYFIKKYDQIDKPDERALVSFRKPDMPMNIDDLENIYNKYKVNKSILVFPGDPEKDRKILFNRKKEKDDRNKNIGINELIEQLKQNQAVDSQSLEMFNQDDLVFNITKHVLVPTHIPLSTDEKLILLKKYSISVNQLPKILSSDPVTKYFGLKRGQVFKIIRDSETAGKYITYRVVV